MSWGRKTFVIVSLALLTAFFAYFLAYPMLYVLRGSVYWDGHWTGGFYSSTFHDPILSECMVNSLALGVMVTLLTTVVSLPLALVTMRRDFIGRRWVSALVMLPLILPPFVGAIGMKQMFARGGSVNLLLGKVTWLLTQCGVLSGPWHVPDINWMGESGFWGVVALAALHLYPIMYLNVAASLASVDRSAEEAAANLGGSRWNVFRRVTFPLMLPGYFAGASIVFIWAFTDLGTPLILRYRNVIPVQIFEKSSEPNANPTGYALVVAVLAVTILAFVAARWFVKLQLRAQSTKGTAGESLRRASRWETLFILAFVLGITFVAVIPHVAVILSSLTTPSGWNGTVLPTVLTLDQYHTLVHHPDALHGLLNSLIYSTLATLGAIVLGVVIAWLLTRERFFGQAALDTTVMVPLALPGIVLAFGYLACFTSGPLNPIENPVPLLVISYIVRRLPYMVRAAVAGFQHVAQSLEDASTNLGAGPLMTLRRITMPLVIANLVAGAVLTFVFSMFEVSQSLVLAQEPSYYPVARVLYKLYGRLEEGPNLASAMGVLGMVVLGAGLIIAGKFLGKRMGEIFRASG